MHLLVAFVGCFMRSARRGRPRGHPTVNVHLRLSVEQKRDLDILRKILDGRPSLNGLIQTAVEQFVARKLDDAAVLRDYEARLEGRLRVIS